MLEEDKQKSKTLILVHLMIHFNKYIIIMSVILNHQCIVNLIDQIKIVKKDLV